MVNSKPTELVKSLTECWKIGVMSFNNIASFYVKRNGCDIVHFSISLLSSHLFKKSAKSAHRK